MFEVLMSSTSSYTSLSYCYCCFSISFSVSHAFRVFSFSWLVLRACACCLFICNLYKMMTDSQLKHGRQYWIYSTHIENYTWMLHASIKLKHTHKHTRICTIRLVTLRSVNNGMNGSCLCCFFFCFYWWCADGAGAAVFRMDHIRALFITHAL